MRRLVHEIRRRTGLGASVGIGPNRLVAKVASDAEKPGGFVVLTREQACARFAGAPPSLVPGIGPRTAERLTTLGITTLGELARRRRAAPRGDLRRAPGALAARTRRASRAPARSSRCARPSASRARRRSTSTSPTRRGSSRSSVSSPSSSARGCAATSAAGGRSRSRCGSTTGRPSRARGRSPSATNDEREVGEVALDLLREYAPGAAGPPARRARRRRSRQPATRARRGTPTRWRCRSDAAPAGPGYRPAHELRRQRGATAHLPRDHAATASRCC